MPNDDDSECQLADREASVELQSRSELYSGFRTLAKMHFRYRGDLADHLPDGLSREVADIGGIAAVLPYDPVRHVFVLLRQFRIGAHMAFGKGDMVEIVAGLVDPGETVAGAACRETLEETGVPATDLIEAYRFMPSPGFTTEFATLYCGRVDATNVPRFTGQRAEGELIEPVIVPVADALGSMDAGRLANGYTTQALLWFARHGDRVRQNWLGSGS